MPNGIWRQDLQASVMALAYDFEKRVGTLTLPPATCTDMTGAIALFITIDPHVARIETRAGRHLDTTYVRTTHGWEAQRHA